MVSAFKTAVSEPPIKAEGTGQHTDDLPPGLGQLRERNGKNHQCTAEQPRSIASVLGKKWKQSTHNATFTLSQSGCHEKAHRWSSGLKKEIGA